MVRCLLIIVSSFFLKPIFAQTGYTSILSNSQKEIIPEGITLDPATGRIYVSSIGLKKIISIDSRGMTQDFIQSGQHGYLEGLGMKIDPKKQWIWAVSNEKQGRWYISQLQAFDLKTGAVKQQYLIRDTTRHLFNDLILHPNGRVYVTDTYGSSIYEANPVNRKLEIFVRDSLIAYPNGITFNEDGVVYVATYSHGLIQLDVSSKTLSPLTGYADSVKAFALDGLEYWNHSIIGVYNGAKNELENSIVQYVLNDKRDKIITERIIDKGNIHFHVPTTLVIRSDKLYVLSNSYIDAYNANKESVKGIEDKLGPVRILVYSLK